MTTVREIITDALIEIDDVGFGETPEAAEADRGLHILQSIYDEWVAQGSFGRLNDYLATADYEAKEQDRVIAGSYTITLPTTVDDEYYGERPPLDLSLIVVIGATREINLYDANQVAWIRLDSLTLDDVAPLADRGRQGLACILAKRYAGGRAPVSAQSEIQAARFLSNLSRKSSASRREGQADYF